MTTDLIIPARNERENIAAVIDALPRQAFRHVVVVDNGSTDGTAEVAQSRGAVVLHEPMRGYGAACQRALAWLRELDSPPAIVAFIDADLSDDPAKLPDLIAAIVSGDVDLVIGSRRKLAQPGALLPVQRFGNALSCGLIRMLTGRRYTDLGPMRAVRWSALETIAMRDRTWGWTVEMQYKAAAMGLNTLEIDVPYRPRQAGKSKIAGSITGSIRAGCRILATIGALWWTMPASGRKTY